MHITPNAPSRANFKGLASRGQHESKPDSGDSISLGDRFRDVAATGAGWLGAGIGGLMGALPGAAYALDRKFNDKEILWNVDTDELRVQPNDFNDVHQEARTVDSAWAVSYSLLGACAGLALAGTQTSHLALALASAAAGGLTGYALQEGFRALGNRTSRLPSGSEYFSATVTHCADREIGSSNIRTIGDGLLTGVREGARLGQHALHDLVAGADIHTLSKQPFRAAPGGVTRK